MVKTATKSIHKVKIKNAFTLIEVIFAIVIIAISILALPTILLRDAGDQEQSLVQEGVLVSSAKISQILTYPWDASSPPPLGGIISNSEVVDAAAGDPLLNRNGLSDFRVGHFQDTMRRRMTPRLIARSASAIPANVVVPPTNIADFNDPNPFAAVQSGGALTTAQGYKKQYRYTTTVSYVSDVAGYNNNVINFNFSDVGIAGPTHIKMVQVTTDQLNNTNPAAPVWEPIVQLTSYSSNIGEAEFYKRRY